MFSVLSQGVDETEQMAAWLGELIEPGGICIGLIGDLGAGKTAFTRGLATGLAIPDSRQVVTSPTFVLIQEYEGRMPLYHFDSYRLASVESFVDLGVDEYFEAGGVCVVEWADRVSEVMPPDRLEISLVSQGPQTRRLDVVGTGPRGRRLGERWRQRLCDEGNPPETT